MTLNASLVINHKTVLITGASGFLGSWLADEFAEARFDLIGIDLRAPLKPQIWKNFSTSSLETVDFAELLNNEKLHAILHLAGSASVPASVKDPYADFSSLLPGTARLALYINKVQPQARFFLFSSAAVYGNIQKLPISENCPVMPISPYGVHKSIAENLLSHYARIYNLNITIFRVFSVYGPGLRKQLIWDVCQRAITAHKNGEEAIMLFGTGLESRDFIYVKDICKAVLCVLNHSADARFEVYNVASGVESTVKEVAEYLIKHLRLNVHVLFNGVVPKGDPTNWRADITRLHKIGFSSQYNLDEGLSEVVDWVKAEDLI